MLKNKKSLILLAASMFALVGCDADRIKYPSNYDDNLYNFSDVDTENKVKHEVVETEYENYYKSLVSDNQVYEEAINEILLKIASFAHDGGRVDTIKNDTYEDSVYLATAEELKNYNKANVLTRAEDSLVSTSKNGSYEKDNLFYETKFVQYLNENYYYLNIDKSSVNQKGQLVTPAMEFEDIYGANGATTYKDYLDKEVNDDITINYLTSEYIYNKSYASIGNTNARNVQVIKIEDRSDEPGDAKKLIRAYVNQYILGRKADGTGSDPTYLGKDPEFTVLARLWKGITSSTAKAVEDGRYNDEVVLTTEEEQWLKDNKIITGTNDEYQGTLAGKVLDDKKKLEAGKNDFNKVDSSLESSYTGSYTYDFTTGIRKAIDNIATTDLITKGIYIKSSGISALPSGLTDRIFSSKLSTNKETLNNMRKDENVGKLSSDTTMFEPDGNRYMTVADTLTTDAVDNIVYFDASSKTYYITRILDVVDTSGLKKGNSNSCYDDDKKEQLAREVAYEMSTTGSNKTDSIVYWLSRCDIDYSDVDFLEYMKSNYKDIFKDDNPWADEPKIDLENNKVLSD